MLPKPLASAIIILVSVIWALNFFMQFLVTTYHPDITLNGIFMGIVGGALALSRKDKDEPPRGGTRHKADGEDAS
jgi:hypothetical protein